MYGTSLAAWFCRAPRQVERQSMKVQIQHSIDVQIEYCTWVLTTLIQVQAWLAAARLENTTHEVVNRQAEIIAAILETLRNVKDEQSGTKPVAVGSAH
jgi:hypothetical protein